MRALNLKPHTEHRENASLLCLVARQKSRQFLCLHEYIYHFEGELTCERTAGSHGRGMGQSGLRSLCLGSLLLRGISGSKFETACSLPLRATVLHSWIAATVELRAVQLQRSVDVRQWCARCAVVLGRYHFEPPPPVGEWASLDLTEHETGRQGY